MSWQDRVTENLNTIEVFIQDASHAYFPVKILGWLVLFFALIGTNIIAICKWPISRWFRAYAKTDSTDGMPLNVFNEIELNNVLARERLVLVDFWAQWCGPCLLMNRAINDLAQTYKQQIIVVKVDVSLDATLSKKQAVRGLPTVVLFKNGVEVTRKSGSLTKKQLSEIIEKHG